MNEFTWRSPKEEAGLLFGVVVLAILLVWGGSCEKEVEMKDTQMTEIVESVRRVDPEPGDTLLVKVKVEIDGMEQKHIADELKAAFPGVMVFLAGPSADLEVIRHKLAADYEAKEVSDGEGT